MNVAPPVSLSRSEAGIIASIQAKPGRRYELEFSPDLTVGSWATIASENVVKAGTLLLSDDRDSEAGYYRMRLSLP